MNRRSLWMLALAASGLLLMLLRPSGELREPRVPAVAPETAPLPWVIETDSHGGSRVFGITLGLSPLIELEQLLGGDAELTLFEQPDGRRMVEAFLDNRTAHGLKADFIAELGADPGQLEAMFGRGLRIARGRESARRVTLHPDDARAARGMAVVSLTYLPAIDLDTELLERRFGTPDERIAGDAETIHWLYPRHGLDIVVSHTGREVLQYVAPRDFARLRAPLDPP